MLHFQDKTAIIIIHPQAPESLTVSHLPFSFITPFSFELKNATFDHNSTQNKIVVCFLLQIRKTNLLAQSTYWTPFSMFLGAPQIHKHSTQTHTKVQHSTISSFQYRPKPQGINPPPSNQYEENLLKILSLKKAYAEKKTNPNSAYC